MQGGETPGLQPSPLSLCTASILDAPACLFAGCLSLTSLSSIPFLACLLPWSPCFNSVFSGLPSPFCLINFQLSLLPLLPLFSPGPLLLSSLLPRPPIFLSLLLRSHLLSLCPCSMVASHLVVWASIPACPFRLRQGVGGGVRQWRLKYLSGGALGQKLFSSLSRCSLEG